MKSFLRLNNPFKAKQIFCLLLFLWKNKIHNFFSAWKLTVCISYRLKQTRFIIYSEAMQYVKWHTFVLNIRSFVAWQKSNMNFIKQPLPCKGTFIERSIMLQLCDGVSNSNAFSRAPTLFPAAPTNKSYSPIGNVLRFLARLQNFLHHQQMCV